LIASYKGLLSLRKVIISLCFLFLCTACLKQPANDMTKPITISPETRITQYLQELTGDDFSGRQAGSAGESQAGWYLASFMQKSGLLPSGEKGTYFQSFPLKRYEPVLVDRRMTFRLGSKTGETMSENILGLLPGLSDEIIVVSAHYDHLGVIENRLYPGANDNASGVAAIMELISAMQKEKPPYSVLFAFWGAEEMGLLGSGYFCDNPLIPLQKIKCVLNLDSIGNILPDKKILGWKANKVEPDSPVIETISREGWVIEWENNDRHSSDHASFAKKEIAAYTLLSPRWLENNHTPQDNIKTINTGQLAELVLAIKKALLT